MVLAQIWNSSYLKGHILDKIAGFPGPSTLPGDAWYTIPMCTFHYCRWCICIRSLDDETFWPLCGWKWRRMCAMVDVGSVRVGSCESIQAKTQKVELKHYLNSQVGLVMAEKDCQGETTNPMSVVCCRKPNYPCRGLSQFFQALFRAKPTITKTWWHYVCVDWNV